MAFQFAPIELHACVYVLELEDDCIYVGATMNFNVRMAQHFCGKGSKWTKLHKPLRVLEVIYPMTPGLENKITQAYFERKGKEKVRGGSWCKMEISSSSTSSANPYTILLDSSPVPCVINAEKNKGFLSGYVEEEDMESNSE